MPLSREHETLEHLITHEGWALIQARIQDTVRILYQEILSPSEERKKRLPDDFIRGSISALRELVEWPQAELKLAYDLEAEQVAAARDAAEIIPLFGEGRPFPGNGDGHGRPEGEPGSA
jgi:hypothetical protein